MDHTDKHEQLRLRYGTDPDPGHGPSTSTYLASIDLRLSPSRAPCMLHDSGLLYYFRLVLKFRKILKRF